MRGKEQAGVVQYACAQNYMAAILITCVTWIWGLTKETLLNMSTAVKALRQRK
jgi:hypothetical protein